MLFLAAVHANSSFKALIIKIVNSSFKALLPVISDSHYMVTWSIHNINFIKLLWNYEFIFYEDLLSLKIKPFLQKFYTTKIWSHTVSRVHNIVERLSPLIL